MAMTAYMIKKLGVVSVAKFCAVFGLIWGFFMGLVVAFGAQGIAATMGLGSYGTGVGIVGFITAIIIGGIAGFIGGAILAIVYNIVLGAIGGIEMDLELKT
jgi:hypothetical protein